MPQDSHGSVSDDIWKAGKPYHTPSVAIQVDNERIRKDTHVPRAGRDLIRKTLEDANVPVSVRFSSFFPMHSHQFHFSSWRYRPNTPSSATRAPKVDGTLP